MKKYYTREKNVQMLIYLMKKNGIKKVIASPGTTNITFVASIQNDDFFEVISVADERSAAYMACGMAAESGEPVALSCTGATASRNYIPGLTEAFYRKLPVLAITSTQYMGYVGQLVPQVIDRTTLPNDIAVKSVQIPMIRCEDDEWSCNIKLNSALLALFRNGGGPVHINLETEYCKDFDVQTLPTFRYIQRIQYEDKWPELPRGQIGIFIGSHVAMSSKLEKAIEHFCEVNNAVVFVDHTSNYHGSCSIHFNLVVEQKSFHDYQDIDCLIDIGEMSGAYMYFNPREVWRVNLDGEIRDTWRKITYIFDMNESAFFEHYCNDNDKSTELYLHYKELYSNAYNNIKENELPFSNIWMAYVMSNKLPDHSVLHLGILNSLRSWNYFEISNTIDCYCNTGGFGIDGITSSFIGSSLVSPRKLHFLIIGDLAFFYDLNAIANKNIHNNIRILLINNGCGAEFKLYSHPAKQFGMDADNYIAAKGHYGQKSSELVKHFAQDLGFYYLTASNKEDFRSSLTCFLDEEINQPIIFEVFTMDEDESEALRYIHNLVVPPKTVKDKAKDLTRSIIGDQGVSQLKKFLKG